MTSPPLPPDNLEDSAQPAGLFGATLDTGTFDPAPVISIDVTEVSHTPSARVPVVIDGLSITWGRDDPLAQPEPATGQVTLFDPTRRWATTRQLVGLPVAIRFTGATAGVSTSLIFFRGRIATVRISPKTVTYPDGTVVRGALVELSLVSVLADLGNRVPVGAWPEETMPARRDRLLNLASPLLSTLTIRPFWLQPHVAPIDADQQSSVLDHITTLYDSCGVDRLNYDPDRQLIEPVYRREYTSSRSMGRLWWEFTGARGNKGVYVRARQIRPDDAPSSVPVNGVYLDSAALEHDPGEGITRGPQSHITRVQVTHPTGSSPDFPDRTVERSVPGRNEALLGTRAARVDSIISWDNMNDTGADDLVDFVSREGALWQMTPVTYHSGPVGGFESNLVASWLLGGVEGISVAFLQRSWLPQFGIRPVFGLMGATITYRASSWHIEANLAPMVTTAPQHPLTWDEFNDVAGGYVVGWYDDDNPHGMHESLTYEDLGYVGIGLRADETIGPDAGWEFYA